MNAMHLEESRTWTMSFSFLLCIAACSEEKASSSGDGDVGDGSGGEGSGGEGGSSNGDGGGDGDGDGDGNGDGDDTDPNCEMLGVSEIRLDGDEWSTSSVSWGRGVSDSWEGGLGAFQGAPLVRGHVSVLGRLADQPGEAAEFIEGDADGDGTLDLFAHRPGSWGLGDPVLSNVGYFPGGSAPYVELFQVEPRPEFLSDDLSTYLPIVGHVAVDDIDEDGDDDVILGVDGGPWIYENAGDGEFSLKYQSAPTELRQFHSEWATLIDLNSDGHDDYVSVSSKNIYMDGDVTDFLVVWYGDVSGALGAPEIYEIGSRDAVVTHFAAGDFDGDDDVDVVFPYYPDLLVFEGKSDGTFAPVRTLLSDTQSIAHLTASDFDRDGRPDLAMWARDESYEDEIRISLDPLATTSLEQWAHPRPGYSYVLGMTATPDGQGLWFMEQVNWPTELATCEVACEDHSDCSTGEGCYFGLCSVCDAGDAPGGAGGQGSLCR